ncbi:hypothetical protein DL93DRAFT_1777959 [Clavulina sp. PMI_390]|nr:hypothetical protein DL93DRAFT_1777959 [Clavulina sp. PMI_390]
MCQHVPGANPSVYYTYDSSTGLCDGGPTKSICIIFLILFTITTIAHFAQSTMSRRLVFLPTLALGGVCALAGWSARLWSSFNPGNFKAFITQITILSFVPAFITAANILIFCQIIQWANARNYARLSPKAFAWIFIPFEVIAFGIQSTGGSTTATHENTQMRIGTRTDKVGIVVELTVMALYTLLAMEVFWRMSADLPIREHGPEDIQLPDYDAAMKSSPIPVDGAGSGMASWQIVGKQVQSAFIGIGISTLLLFMRAIFRICEYSDGWGSKIQSNQAAFNFFEGGCIFLAMLAINFFHPGRLLKPRASVVSEV